MTGRLTLRERLLIAAVGAVGPLWVRWCGRIFGRGSRGLTDQERLVITPWFDGALLDRVQVSVVERLVLPSPRVALRLLGAKDGLVTESPAAITLGSMIVVSGEMVEGDVPAPLLFHELVHAAQYQTMGLRGFLRAYVRGWVLAGHNYYANPLEREAFDLQRRFEEGERFRVAEEIGKV